MATDSVCPKCGGTGWIIIERGGVSGAEACDCRFQGRAARMEERAQIPPNIRHATFDNFVASVADNPMASRELKGILMAVKTYAQGFPHEQHPGLLLIGQPGCGKTHLAVAVLKTIIQKGFEGLFWNYQTLLNSIKAGFNPASNSSDREAYRMALEAEVLLLDDLGSQRGVSEWVEDTITSIITYRCDNRKPLIATTNLPDPDAGGTVFQKTAFGPDYVDTLERRVGSRARSRLFEMCTVFRMPLVEDYRVRKAKTF